MANGLGSHTFALDPDVFGVGSAATLQLTGTTDADVALAIAADTAFPTRPNGEIDLAHIGLTTAGGEKVAATVGQVTVGFEFSAGLTAGVGIFDDPQKALAALALGETPGLDLTVGATPGTRYALLRAGYHASGTVSGTHPIGAIGSFTFGVATAASGLSAVLHRFPNATGARTALQQTVTSWKLPRQIGAAGRLAPGTWVIGEADGSVAVNLAAALGYNFDFIRQAKVAGLSGDIGLKIDAAATATFGFEVSGRYLVVLGRESDSDADAHLRLRLFKLSTNGMQFGLNLKIGITGVETVTPDSVDDFVKAVFGVHGGQIVAALNNIERWTDPTASVGTLVAGLVNAKALELLQQVTGINAQAEFDAARARLLAAIKLYQDLPALVSSELWGILGRLDAGAAALFSATLNLLASDDPAVQKKALLDLLNTNGFANTPAGRIISALAGALADRGVLSLFDRLPDVRAAARTVLAILDGDVIRKLEAFVNEKLNLDKVIAAVNATDFNALDSFLVGRLSAFFDKDLHFADLNEVKDTINLVVTQRKAVYAKVQKALNSRYGLDLATTWQKTSATTAVLDVVFDTSATDGRQMLAALLQQGDFDQFLLTPGPAVRINAAVLTHVLTRKTTVDLSLPFLSFHGESVNQAMARVTAEDDGARVLLFEASGQDVVSVSNKFKSSLAVTVAATVSPGDAARLPDFRVHSTDGASWSYQLLRAKAGMGRAELEASTRPFIDKYMAGQVPDLNAWYADFESTVDGVLHGGAGNFGDVCAALEVTMPGEALAAWARPVADVTAAARVMSKAIQASLKDVLRFYYLSDIHKLHDLTPSAALLVWAAIPPANDVSVDGDTITFDVGDKVFWDLIDPVTRKAMAGSRPTRTSLLGLLPSLRLRLDQAGRHGDVPFYQDSQVSTIIGAATSTGDPLLLNLLTFEAVIVEKAAEALEDIQRFIAVAGTSPTEAIVRLADFAADITTAFNRLMGNTVFGGVPFRPVGQSVFAEASRALDPALAGQPRALLAVTVLNPQSQGTFTLQQFLDGAIPPPAAVAVSERLVNA